MYKYELKIDHKSQCKMKTINLLQADIEEKFNMDFNKTKNFVLHQTH